MTPRELAEDLSSVIDPELGVDIVSLGLIYGIDIEPDTVTLRMTLTSPDCPMGDLLASMAASKVRHAARDRRADIEIVDDPPWSPGMMNETAMRQLGIR